MGENLAESREYCDLSLYFDNRELVEAVRDPGLMEALARRYIAISVQVSDQLTRVINRQKDVQTL
jgi:hypothetical protein